ncbi:hypothetical protein LOK49_LG10G02015 [Camellia lanceoleosa]|uniref:Uncharacterized protein n=1 Tax=Camellia lanceoleosa TaxID=1840588 RepID=A0ACC0G841_9ERIC|nr:hypothetical protein LOK49_LG10G02015 [Camellia lanceoleosa]
MSEEEEEQIWESDSVWERLRNQPIYSPPPSPSSGKVFLISPQLYFSLPPPPSILISSTTQIYFSAAQMRKIILLRHHMDVKRENKALLMRLLLLTRQHQSLVEEGRLLIEEERLLRLQRNLYLWRPSRGLIDSTDTEEIRQYDSSKDSLRDFDITLEVALKCLSSKLLHFHNKVLLTNLTEAT